MERAYAPLVRQFSSIKGYQTGYTLVYSLDAAAEGSCQLTLARQGAQEQRVSMLVPLDPQKGYRLLQYLYENAVQPGALGRCDCGSSPGAGGRTERRHRA